MSVAALFRRCAGCAARMCGCGGRRRKSRPCRGAISVAGIDNGSSARVVCIQGDGKAAKQLAAMGVVPGAIIVKQGSSPLRGPVVLKKGATQFAIGYAMALRLLVDNVDEK